MIIQELCNIIIAGLNVLGSIGKDQKLRLVKNDLDLGICIDDSSFQSVSRRWHGDSRDSAMVVIKKIVRSGLEMNIMLKRFTEIVGIADIYKEIRRQLNDSLDRAPSGLRNLAETYAADQATVNDIQSLIGDLLGRPN